MPELPEVENIVREMRAELVGQRVLGLRVYFAGIIEGSAENFRRQVRRRRIASVKRRGKLIIVGLDSGRYVLIHLKMTGQLVLSAAAPAAGLKPHKHTHVVFKLADGRQLLYNDVRKFGFLALADEAGLQEFLERRFAFGPEPFDRAFTAGYLHGRLQGRKLPVKQLLLDQTVLAGLGNIYADESLHLAGIHPVRAAARVSIEETIKLHKAIKNILRRAIAAGGSTANDYVRLSGQKGAFQKQHRVYGRAGRPCAGCGAAIERVTLGGRGTHFCPVCQT